MSSAAWWRCGVFFSRSPRYGAPSKCDASKNIAVKTTAKCMTSSHMMPRSPRNFHLLTLWALLASLRSSILCIVVLGLPTPFQRPVGASPSHAAAIKGPYRQGQMTICLMSTAYNVVTMFLTR